MTRPVSIVRFEQFYLGAVVIGLVNSLMTWSRDMNAPEVRQATAVFGSSFFVVALVLGVAIDLLLWYCVARRGSVVAKWFVVVFFAFAALGMMRALAKGTFVVELTGVLTIVALILQAVAVWLLFRPDTRPWFASKAGRPLE